MNSNKVLIFGSRIPDLETKQGKNFLFLLKILLRDFQISFLPLQTLFWEERTIDKMEEMGINIVYKKKADSNQTFEKRFHDLLEPKKYDIILFDSVYTAKYYIPYFYEYFAEVIILMDARNSQYLMTLNFLKECTDNIKRIKLFEKSKLSRQKEIPVYNYFDGIIVSNKFEQHKIEAELPKVPIKVIPMSLDNNLEKYEISNFFLNIKKRALFNENVEKKIKIKKINIEKDRTLIDEINKELKSKEKDYILIVPDNAFVPEDLMKKMMFTMESHPLNGMVAPASNYIISPTVRNTLPPPDNTKDFSEFLRKHYIGNFGCWYEINYIIEKTFLIRNELLDKVGLLDTRFNMLHYAFMDLCFRIQQAGYRIIINQESFIYCKEEQEYKDMNRKIDQRLLIDKWGLKGEEFLVDLKD